MRDDPLVDPPVKSVPSGIRSTVAASRPEMYSRFRWQGAGRGGDVIATARADPNLRGATG